MLNDLKDNKYADMTNVGNADHPINVGEHFDVLKQRN